MARKPEPVDTPILTPCRRLCRLDDTGAYCTGCGRTRAELGAWRGMTNAARQALMDTLPARRLTLPDIQA